MSQRVLRKRTKDFETEALEREETGQKENRKENSEKPIKGLKRQRTDDQTSLSMNKDDHSERRGHRMRTRSMEAISTNKQSGLYHMKEVRSDSGIREQEAVAKNNELRKGRVAVENDETVNRAKKAQNKINSSPIIKQNTTQKSDIQPMSTINKQLERILQRLDSNETRFKEQLHHLNQSVEQLKGKVLEEMPNKEIEFPRNQHIPQKDIQLAEFFSERNKGEKAPLKYHPSDISRRSSIDLNHDENDPYPSNSAMALYKISQEIRSPPHYHSSRKRQKWTEDEVVALIDLVSIYGPSWAKIKKMDIHGWLQRRTQVDLKDKARIIKQHLLETPDIWNQFVLQCENWEAVSVGNSLGHR
ncbi:unnamed protein product, partial [Pneumocystis jirovecii]